MTEIFKPIEGYDGYSVSNTGKVLNNETGKFLKGCLLKRNYQNVTLCDANGHKTFLIHRLIAEAFIPNPENKPCVDHIDNNPSNNSLENLRWATNQENHRNTHTRCTNTSGVKGVVWYKPTGKWRAQICINGVGIHLGYFDTIEDATLARQTYAKEAFGEFVNDCERLTC
jgi:hypothetical protein